MGRLRALVKKLLAEYLYRRRSDLVEAQRGILILMYHEIAERRDDRFRLFPVLCTTPTSFRQQVEWLRKHFELISIEEAEERLRKGVASDSRAVVITSNDGWSGFAEQARALGVKSTVYVTTCVLDHTLPWYVRWRVLLHQKPYLLKPLAHELGDFEPFPDADTAISRLKALDVARIERLWQSFCGEAGFREESLPKGWFVNKEQVRQAAKLGITIGSHTVSHPQLTREFPHLALNELGRSKELLESITGHAVRHFAYPSGDHNDSVVQLTADCGYATAVTTQPGWNLSGHDLLRLKRVDVHEAACVDHFGRFSEAMFALWITGGWTQIKRKIRFWA